jgi:galactose-1-phosphate uridylyltransferase
LSEFKNEFEVPPRTKIRVVTTVEETLFEEIKRIHEEEVALCKGEDRNEPEWSNTLEIARATIRFNFSAAKRAR